MSFRSLWGSVLGGAVVGLFLAFAWPHAPSSIPPTIMAISAATLGATSGLVLYFVDRFRRKD